MNSPSTPGFVVLRRYLAALGALFAALAVAGWFFASYGGLFPDARAALLQAAAFAFAHGIALAALAPLAQRPVALLALGALLLAVLLFAGGALGVLLLAVEVAALAKLGGAVAISGWLLYAYDRLRA